MTIKENDIKQALEKSLTLYTNNLSLFTPSPVQPKYINETITLLFDIIKVIRLVLEDNLSPHFKVSEQKAPLGIKASPLGKQIYTLITCPYLGKINEYFPDGIVAKHPLIELFLSCLAQSEFSELALANPISKIKQLNVLVDTIRTEAKKKEITKDNKERLILSQKIKHRNDTANKNHNELSYYITKLLARYPEISIIWFELNYSPRFTESTSIVTPIVYLTVKQHREQFFQLLRSSYYCPFSRQLIGFAWKLKYTTFKGFYYELLLLFDIPENKPIEQTIANYWLRTAGSQAGYQCKRIFYISKKNNDKRSPSDKQSKERQQENKAFIKQAIISLTKTDDYLYYTTPNKDRTFNKGQLRTPYTKRKTKKQLTNKDYTTL